MHKTFLILAGLSGLLAVVLGASGAHSLAPQLTNEQFHAFETANRYHFYHTLALLAVSLLYIKYPSRLFKFSGYAFLIGILCFSGSLYLLSTQTLLHIESWRFLGPVTPIGGLFFIAGWLLVMLGAITIKEN